jgi:signal transduction histidine kinase
MQQQADGWKELESSTYTTELRPELRSAPGRARWLEMVANPGTVDLLPGNRLGISTDKPIDEVFNASLMDAPSCQGIEGVRQSDSFAALLHDARNMVSAIDLYCDLLEEPGILAPSFRHYAGELRLVGGTSRRLLEKLTAVERQTELQCLGRNTAQEVPQVTRISTRIFRRRSASGIEKLPASSNAPDRCKTTVLRPISEVAPMPESLSRGDRKRAFQAWQPIASLAEELHANRNLLSALVGPAIKVSLSISGGHHPIAMASDDLTRVLVNLARNAAAAMPNGGHIQIALEEGKEFLSLSFTDNGPGIPEIALETIFKPGYSTHLSSDPGSRLQIESECNVRSNSGAIAGPAQHRGLGLPIVRSIVSAAGGSVSAANRIGNPNPEGSKPGKPAPLGAIIRIKFPLRASPAAI